MTDILLRNVPDSVHEQVKKLARERSVSVSDIVKEMVQLGLRRRQETMMGQMNAWDAMRKTIGGEAMLDDASFDAFEAELRAARQAPDRAIEPLE